MTTSSELQDQSAASGARASLLGALVIVARHRGIHLSQAQLRRDHRIGPGGPTSQQVLEIARANDIRALAAHFTFRDLMRAGPALPLILLLKNGSAMVVLRVEPAAQPPM